MKKILVLIAIFITIKASAQIPIPNLCAVGVDTITEKPILYWTIPDTSQIDGYIIKRIIYNGTGVVDGTLNNIAVLKNDTINSFVDTTTKYNTQALPQIRSEKYVVVAYDTSSGQTIYSGFSNLLSTINLKAEYDSCANIITLQWTTNQNIDQYTILCSVNGQYKEITHTSDTSFSYIPQDNGLYNFRIRAHITNSCFIDSVYSNISSALVQFYQRPKLLYIQSLEANYQDSIKVNLHISLRNTPAHIILYRDGNAIKEFDNDFHSFIYDPTSTDKSHTYVLRAYSSCNQIIDSSNIARNIILKGLPIDKGNTRINSLEWNQYPYWAGKTLNYKIFYSSDGNSFSEIDNTIDTSYNHNLHDDILISFMTPFCYYYIVAQEINDTILWQNAQATSNIVKIKQNPILNLPNAINPLSNNPQDREFKVYVDFIEDYQLTIFDRFGRIIFSSNSPDKSWDGHLPDGRIAPIDVYFYLIKYTINGKKFKLRGSVNVIY